MRMFKKIEPYATHMLAVGQGHTIYVEESGNPHGIPVVFLHGGPGNGLSQSYRRRFNPKLYRIIGFDQRGCGRSTPLRSLKHNTTADLVADMEKIRLHLGVEEWLVTGGSWGSTLALVYAQQYVKNVLGLILSGIFLASYDELDWFINPMGLPRLRVQPFRNVQKVLNTDHVGEELKHLLLETVFGKDSIKARKVVHAWVLYEAAAAVVEPLKPNFLKGMENEAFLTGVKTELHYIKNRHFLKPGQILDGCDVLRAAKIPVTLIHGALDFVCPLKSAFDLATALPQAKLKIVADAGHMGSPYFEELRRCEYARFAQRYLRKRKR